MLGPRGSINLCLLSNGVLPPRYLQFGPGLCVRATKTQHVQSSFQILSYLSFPMFPKILKCSANKSPNAISPNKFQAVKITMKSQQTNLPPPVDTVDLPHSSPAKACQCPPVSRKSWPFRPPKCAKSVTENYRKRGYTFHQKNTTWNIKKTCASSDFPFFFI